MKITEGNIYYDIIMCGTGATGSQLLPFLTQLLAYSEGMTLTLVDEDIIENKNCKNQKFLPDDENKYKAEVLCRRYKNVYPTLRISCITKFIKNIDDIKEIAKDNASYYRNRITVIIGCVDNNPTRKVLSEFYKNFKSNIIYIDSGNGTIDRIGQIVVASSLNKQSCKLEEEAYGIYPCVADLFDEINTDTDSVDKATSCGYNTDSNPQNIATNIMAASTLFSVLTNLIQFNEITPGTIYFDATAPSVIFRQTKKIN